MALSIGTNTNSTTPNYWRAAQRSRPSGEAWTTMRANHATEFNDTAIVSFRFSSNSPLWLTIKRVDAVWDLRPYILSQITAASISFGVQSIFGYPPFATDTQRGLALFSQLESGRNSVNHTSSNFYAIYNHSKFGNTYKMATTIPYSTVIAGGGGTKTFTFNATGLAYLNSVPTKPTFPGYAIFGIAHDGEAIATPTWTNGASSTLHIYGSPTLSLTMNNKLRINISNNWREAYVMKINVGNVWRDASELGINISNAWRYI